MSDKQKQVDPIPEEFASYEEAAEFWDTHDTTDYLDSLETVSVDAEFRRRRYEVEIDEETMKVLNEQAEKRGLPVSNVLSELLREKLRQELRVLVNPTPHLVPLLNELCTDEHIPLIARNHAERILKKREK
jgi:CopG antitoxin of type II toxin-antitoxin system